MLVYRKWMAALAIMGGTTALACNNKVSADHDTAGGTMPEPAVSDNDTTDETATSAPPAPEADPEGSPPSPHDVWVHGAWHWADGRYHWYRGRWVSPRPGYALIQARWDEEGGHWVRHPSRWARAERREEKREERR